MKSLFIKMFLFLLVGICLSDFAYSLPAFNPKCAKNIRINSPANGAGVFFDHTCKVAYVLPPVRGQLRMEGLARTSNLEMCSNLTTFEAGFKSLARAFSDTAKKYEQALAENAPGNANLESELQKKLDELFGLYEKFRRKLSFFGEIPGASAQISYNVETLKLVEEYKRLNPRVHFQPLTLHRSKIYLARKVGSAQDRQLYNAVMFSSIPGVSSAADNQSADNGVQAGEAQSGQLILSLVGICPYVGNGTTLPSQLSQDDLARNMVAKVQYEYELQVTRRYKMTYNLAALLRKLQRSESRGGFFTAKAMNKIITERSLKEEFDIEVESEDGRFAYDDGFAQLMKTQLLGRALKNLEIISQGTPADAPALTKPDTIGVSVAAKEMQKCPHIYCQAGAAILRFSEATFGGARTLSDFINSVDVTQTETSTERKTVSFSGGVDFVTRDN